MVKCFICAEYPDAEYQGIATLEIKKSYRSFEKWKPVCAGHEKYIVYPHETRQLSKRTED